MLAVAIHADHVLETQLVGELVAGLHAAAEPQVMRHREHLGAGFCARAAMVPSAEQSSITSTGTPGTQCRGSPSQRRRWRLPR